MAQIVIKSKDEVARMPAIADGQYTATSTYSADAAKAIGSPNAVATLTFSGGGTQILSSVGNEKYDLAAFKAELTLAFDKGTITQFTLDAVAKPDTAGAAKETPWLLYAAGAAVLYLILKGKKS